MFRVMIAALRRLLLGLGALALLTLLGLGALALRLRAHGISARDEPTALEAIAARRLRSWAIPAPLRTASNPVAASDAGLARARAHFADHCASCHGNDGRGRTPLGQGLYPKAPDMTLADTQSLADGELFAIIENGVRLTGMPAWGTPGPEDDAETWELVHFIRHLKAMGPEELAEMESMNPKTRRELEEEDAIRRFLAGEDAKPSPSPEPHEH
jgi:mono/diheme cytochrome c family protein